jgi:hypothetical protein
MKAGGVEDDAVGQWQAQVEGQARGPQSQGVEKLDHPPLPHQRDGAQGVALGALLQDAPEDLEQGANRLLASASLDRLRHNAYCLVLDGQSYRAPKQLAGNTKPAPQKPSKSTSA